MAVDEIIPNDHIICPDHLKDALAGKCNLLEYRPMFYIGELWVVDNDEESIDRIAKIGNIGSILCSPETKQYVTKLQIGNADNGIAFRFETINMPFLHIRSKKLFKKAFQSNS